MKKMKHVVLLSVFLITGVASAMSSQIPVNGGGILEPTQTMDISFLNSGLVPGIKYSAQCTIDNPNQDSVILHFNLIMNYSVAFSARIDDTSLSSSYNAEIKPGKHTYTVDKIGLFAEINNMASLQFINLDRDNQVTISNCYAFPAL